MNFLIRKISIDYFNQMKILKPLSYAMFSKSKPTTKIDFNKDYYAILGIDSKSTSKNIRKSYLQLVKKYHPDAQSSDSQQQTSPNNHTKSNDNQKNKQNDKFIDIQQAYQILSDQKLRKQYDYQTNSSSAQSQSYRNNDYSKQYHKQNKQNRYARSQYQQTADRNNYDKSAKQYWQKFKYQQSKWQKQFDEQMKQILENEEKMREHEKALSALKRRQKIKEQKQKYGQHFYTQSEEELEKLKNYCSGKHPLFRNCHRYEDQNKKQPRKMERIMDQLGFKNLSNYWSRMRKKFSK